MKNKNPEVAVGILIENNRKEIFLGKSVKFKGKWIVPGGHIEYGEKIEDCLKREIREELGIEITNITFLRVQESIFSPEHRDNNKHFIFLNYKAKIKDSRKKIVLEREEFEDYLFILPNKALKKLDLNKSTRSLISFYVKNI